MSIDSAISVITVEDLLLESEKYKYNDRERSFQFALQAYEMIRDDPDSPELTRTLLLLAYAHHQRSEHEEFFRTIGQVIDISEQRADKDSLAYAYYLSACCYRNLGDHSDSADNFLKGIALEEELLNRETIVRLYNGLGHLYHIIGDNEKALESFKKGLGYLEKTNIPELRANLLGNQAEVFLEFKRYDEAKENLLYAADIYTAANDLAGVGVTQLRLGKLLFAMGDHRESLRILNELYGRAVALNFQIGMTVIGTDLARILIDLGDHKAAEPIIDSALEVSLQINYQNNQHELYFLKHRIALLKNDHKAALEFFMLYHELKEKTYTREAEIKLKNAESLTEMQLIRKEAELDRFKNVELRKAYEEIEIRNKEITDSIRYASRIQSAILPDRSLFSECFDEYFILFRPRDIVSGDFYWFHSFTTSEGSFKLIAVADCTGHGVPGSLMTMIGSTILNQIVIGKGITDPAMILEELDKDLLHALKSNSIEARDGMDISIVLYHEATRTISFSSAIRPLYIFKFNDTGIRELAGTKRSIGGASHSVHNKFSNTVEILEPGDRVYMFSDGYADQFGGLKGKKLMAKNFRSLIHRTSAEPVHIQEKSLHEFFDNWKGENEQVDDVTVICFKVK